MQAARCVNKPLLKATIRIVTAPSRRVSVCKRTARSNTYPARSGNGSGEDHTEDSYKLPDAARSSIAADKELSQGRDVGHKKNRDAAIEVAAVALSLTSVIVSWIQTIETAKQTTQINQQTKIMQQELDALDLAGVAAIARAAKMQINESSAAHLLIQHSGLSPKEAAGLNKKIARNVPSDDSIVEVTHRTTVSPALINPGVKLMATMSSGRAPPQASTSSARIPIVWDLPLILYSIYTLAMAIALLVFFLPRIWRHHKAEQNAKRVVRKNN